MKTPATQQFLPDPVDNARLANLCGPLDENLRQIAAALDITLFRRGEKFIADGPNAARAVELLQRFYSEANNPISIDEIQLALVEQRTSTALAADKPAILAKHPEETPESPVLKTRRTDLRGRTPHQSYYLKNILEHDVTFGIGPAGTGKTYLAVACAVDALERDAVRRIVLTRPAVEAGERLGFLPGDLAQKVDPYLRPLYDALYDLLGFDRTQKMFEKQAIEIAPLAYMRGRTLNHAFIILDEAQNTTPEQMKMFLTRIGFGSKAVDRRHHANRLAARPEEWPGRCAEGARFGERYRVFPFHQCRCGTPSAGSTDCRRLRCRQRGHRPRCRQKISSACPSSTPTAGWLM